MASANNNTISEIDIDKLELETISDEPNEPSADLNVISVKREDTRGRLAFAFVIGFFVILLSGLIVAAFSSGDKIEGSKEMLLVISGILSGPLGFVIGYYFRSTEDN